MRICFVLALVLAIGAAAPCRAAEFTDAELIDGFAKTVFGMEASAPMAQSEAGRVKKFVSPVKVAVLNLSDHDRSRQISRFIAVLNRTIAHVELKPTRKIPKANLTIFLVNRDQYKAAIRKTMPEGSDTLFLEDNDCSAVVGGPKAFELERAFAYIVVDEGDTRFRHCMVEELTQSLGPVNDNDSLARSIYNDTSDLNTFAAFDWFILNMLYDPRITIGMTDAEARAALPAVIADCRRRYQALGLPDEIGVE